ncbi:MAG: MFS transporter [Methanophagales archaeon]|nr:MFS transporter [Methanophagales archaeon]
MRFAVKDTLTEEEIQRGLRTVIKDGLTTQAMVTLTGGVFLVAFAVKLGASNLVIGLLAAITPLAQLVQIPSIYLVEKYRVRRAITVYATASSRIFWFFIALIPFLFSTTEAELSFLLTALFLYAAFGAVGSSSWNPWMHDLVPQDRLGVFFSRRMSLALALGIPLSLAAGIYLDYWRTVFPDNEVYSYSILFFFGFLAGMLGVYFISTIPEPRMVPVEEKTKFFKLISQPFKDVNFKKLIMFLGSWNFAVNLAAPFFTVYMLVRLQLGMSFIIALLVLSQVTSLAFLRIWGRFSDRFSNKSVLGVSGPLFMLCILAWTFTTLPERYALTVPLLIAIHIVMGISTAGVTLASGNIGLKLAPKGQAPAYLAANSLVNSVMAGIAPILGGKFADFFAERELSWTLRYTSPGGDLVIPTLNFQQWDFFFFLAFLLGLYSIHRLALVKEEGEVEEKILIQELLLEVKKPLSNFSTADGLRDMIQFPFSLVRTAFEKVGMRNNRKDGRE